MWQVPLKAVVAQLAPEPKVLLEYLTAMFDMRRPEYDVAAYAEYHDMQVRLHVEHQVRPDV